MIPSFRGDDECRYMINGVVISAKDGLTIKTAIQSKDPNLLITQMEPAELLSRMPQE
jgi:hypothetical protein